MSHNKIEAAATILRSAPKGSKEGWIAVTTELSPDEHAAFLSLCQQRQQNRSTVARDAIQKLIESEARAERRRGERRKAS